MANHEQSNQVLYLLAGDDSKDEDCWWTNLFTDLRPVHVLQNTWCGRPLRPVCSMHIGPVMCNLPLARLLQLA